MKTRFTFDVPAGTFTRTIAGVQVAEEFVNVLTAGDPMDECEVALVAGESDITAAELAGGKVVVLGLREHPGVDPLLSQSTPLALVAGVGTCAFSQKTSEIYALCDAQVPKKKSVRVWLELVVDDLTVGRWEFQLWREVNKEGDEPPPIAAASALNASQSATAAAAARDAANQAKLDAQAARDISSQKATDATNATQLAQDWAIKATSPDGSGNKSAKSYAADAGISATDANQAKLDSQGARDTSSQKATDSTNAAQLAQDWAIKATSPDGSGNKSAKSYAADAGASAGAAATSEGNAAGSAAVANAAALSAGAVGVSLVNPYLAGKATRPGIVTTGATWVARTEDNTGIALGTANLWLHWRGLRPGAALKYLVTKFSSSSNLGVKWEWDAADTLRVRIGNGSNFTTYVFAASVPVGVTVNTWVELDALLDRVGGILKFFLNGVQLGADVSIAAAAGQTLTNTGPLLYGSDGSTHFVGVFGNCTLASTLPTATQVAEIYRAGAIEPFAASFTWIARPFFEQGYGPILADRAGLGQVALLGASGISHIIPRNPPGVPPRAPKTALVFDGNTGTGNYSKLNNQNPLTNDFTTWDDFIFPTTLPTVSDGFSLNAVTASQNLSEEFVRYLQAGSGLLIVKLYGATSADGRQKAFANAVTLLGGKRVVLITTRFAGTVRVFFGIDGDLHDATNLCVETNSGSAPAWSSNVNSLYDRLSLTSNSGFLASLYDHRLYVGIALTEAQLREEYLAGEPQAKWQGGSKVALNSSACTDIDYGAGFTGASATGFTAAVASGNKFARTQPAFNVVPGNIVRVAGTLTLNNGKTVIPQARLTSSIPVSLGAAGAFSVDIVALVATTSSAVNFDTTGDADYTISSLSCTKLGVTTRLRTDSAGLGFAENERAENGSSHFTLSTTGITISPDPHGGRRVAIRASYLASAISALSATTVACVMPPGWAPVDVQVDVGTAADAGRTINLGTSGTPAKYVSGFAIDNLGLKQAPLVTSVVSSRTGNTTLYWQKSGTTTTGELISTVIMLERKY